MLRAEKEIRNTGARSQSHRTTAGEECECLQHESGDGSPQGMGNVAGTLAPSALEELRDA